MEEFIDDAKVVFKEVSSGTKHITAKTSSANARHPSESHTPGSVSSLVTSKLAMDVRFKVGPKRMGRPRKRLKAAHETNNKTKKTMRCSACFQLGHNRSNALCPAKHRNPGVSTGNIQRRFGASNVQQQLTSQFTTAANIQQERTAHFTSSTSQCML
mmetsp:Transcript_15185/g.21311  ORF Transcript_15185/g.21311 Transcript_15185/m.21311 type:complete len:157 (-) Transcript_15185:230-700(-)